MAYQNQIKCIECGKSIPPMPEETTYGELLCDSCYDEYESKPTWDIEPVVPKYLLTTIAIDKTQPNKEDV